MNIIFIVLLLLLGIVGFKRLRKYICRNIKVKETDAVDSCEELQRLSGKVILDQHDENIDALPYGATCIGTSGCGPISLYNVLVLLGRNASLYNILRDFEKNKYIILNGRFGTNPHILGQILKKYQLNYDFYTDVNALEARMQEHDLAILAVWNDRSNLFKGAHFFVVQKLAEGYETYNAGYVLDKTTLENIIGKGKLIKGYLIRR